MGLISKGIRLTDEEFELIEKNRKEYNRENNCILSFSAYCREVILQRSEEIKSRYKIKKV
jgi:hypothetical protein